MLLLAAILGVAAGLHRDFASPASSDAAQFLRADAVNLAAALGKEVDAHMGWTPLLFRVARSRLHKEADRLAQEDADAARLLHAYSKNAPDYALVWPWPTLNQKNSPNPEDRSQEMNVATSTMSSETVMRSDDKGHTITRTIQCDNDDCVKTTRSTTEENGAGDKDELQNGVIEDDDIPNFGGLFKTMTDQFGKYMKNYQEKAKEMMEQTKKEEEERLQKKPEEELVAEKDAEDLEDDSVSGIFKNMAKQFAKQMKIAQESDGPSPIEQMMKSALGSFGPETEDELPQIQKGMEDFANAAGKETGINDAPVQTTGVVQYKKCANGKCVVTTRKVLPNGEGSDNSRITKEMLMDPIVGKILSAGWSDSPGQKHRKWLTNSPNWPFGNGMGDIDDIDPPEAFGAESGGMNAVKEALQDVMQQAVDNPPQQEEDLVPF